MHFLKKQNITFELQQVEGCTWNIQSSVLSVMQSSEFMQDPLFGKPLFIPHNHFLHRPHPLLQPALLQVITSGYIEPFLSPQNYANHNSHRPGMHHHETLKTMLISRSSHSLLHRQLWTTAFVRDSKFILQHKIIKYESFETTRTLKCTVESRLKHKSNVPSSRLHCVRIR
jgi:hypothetical protein